MEELREQAAEAAKRVSSELEKLRRAEEEVAEIAREFSVEPARGSYRNLRFRVKVSVSWQPEPLFLSVCACWTSGKVSLDVPGRV